VYTLGCGGICQGVGCVNALACSFQVIAFTDKHQNAQACSKSAKQALEILVPSNSLVPAGL